MNHIKRLRGHFIALLILKILLIFPIYWIYRFFLNSFGKDTALFSLSITIMVVVILAGRGAIQAHRINSILRKEISDSNHPISPTRTPLIFKFFRMERFHSQVPSSENKSIFAEVDPAPLHFLSFPRKHRGKQPRFPEDKIRKAVLKWESRDPSFSVRTLEEFLAQEFGSGPDGILLMATTTFYDWRRRILKELEAQEPKS